MIIKTVYLLFIVVDYLNSSPILNGTADYIRQLRLWLPVYNTSHLCWRASQHGWASTTFHSRCDNKGSTVTIVRVGKYIFGGYADVSWKSKGRFAYTVIYINLSMCKCTILNVPYKCTQCLIILINNPLRIIFAGPATVVMITLQSSSH